MLYSNNLKNVFGSHEKYSKTSMRVLVRNVLARLVWY